MRALVLNEAALSRLKCLREHAEANRVAIPEIMRMLQGKRRPVGDDPAHVAQIPDGFRVVYSIEQHPMGWVRHLSVSVERVVQGRSPHPKAVAMIAKELGFTVDASLEFGDRVLVQESPTWGWDAPNVIEPLEESE